MAAPRSRTAELREHVDRCSNCERFASHLDELDAAIVDAGSVSVPEALADRVLLRCRPLPSRWQMPSRAAAAAGVVVAVALVLVLAPPGAWEAQDFTPVVAVGPTHPAIVAISMAVEQQPGYLDEPHAVNFAAVEDGLKRLGLTLKSDDVKVDYAAKCYLPHSDCGHLVLETGYGLVSVILMPDYPVGSRALIADRRMTALVIPAGTGAYIVVAASPSLAKRAEKLLVKG